MKVPMLRIATSMARIAAAAAATDDDDDDVCRPAVATGYSVVLMCACACDVTAGATEAVERRRLHMHRHISSAVRQLRANVTPRQAQHATSHRIWA